MILKTLLSGHTYEFKSLCEVMAKANEEKSGDKLAGIAASSAEERIAAKIVLANIKLNDIRNTPAVLYEKDFVTRINQEDLDEEKFAKIKNWTVSELREWILDDNTSGADILALSPALTCEVIAAVCKLMSNLDLIYAAKKIRVTAHCNTTIGEDGVFACRLQPNHTTDDPKGILASLMEGLSYGCGDAVIGLNPVDDSVESVKTVLQTFDDFMKEWKIPTQHCVLAHITTQMEAIRRGAPCQLMFQSLAGSEKGNNAFGVTKEILDEGWQMMKEMGQCEGPNYMYFETGQGSELSSYSHNGWDQVVMESRCYGLARHYKPFLVNTVVGFIGPEYLYDSKQVIRAGLEDHFMGKLTGIPMGCDVCYTNHMKADQNDMDNLITLLATAGISYVMGVPHADDIMLNYQSTGYHETATIRQLLGLHPIKEFEVWLERMGFYKNGKLTELAGDGSVFLRK